MDEAERLVSLARTLMARGGTLESTDSGESIGSAQLLTALERRAVQAASGPVPPVLTAKTAASTALANAESALKKTAEGTPPSNLTDLERASLEAIVEVTGRPAMHYVDGKVQMPPDNLGDNDRWRVLIATARSKINKASAAVGRISIVGASGLTEHLGTGWCAKGGLIVTNRHVVRDLVTNRNGPPDTWTLDTAKQPVIDFAATSGAAVVQRFAITSLAYCAGDEDVDLALLNATSGAASLPLPLVLDWNASSVGVEVETDHEGSPRFRGGEVYVVGHPQRPFGAELAASIFGAADGGKRWSPGLVVRIDSERPMLEHDCSTLGGNSGSCVLTTVGNAVVALHVGGIDVDERTGSGSANVALMFARLGKHPVSELLRAGKNE
jgi:hypothetical protein